MRLTKFKRGFSKKIPYIILILFLFIGLCGIAFFGLQLFLSKQGVFISPLAQNKTEKGNNGQSLLYKKLHDYNIQFSKVEVASDSSYIIFLRDQGEVNIDSDKDIALQISSLQLILSRLTIEGKKFKRLDLRFNKPIIEF